MLNFFATKIFKYGNNYRIYYGFIIYLNLKLALIYKYCYRNWVKSKENVLFNFTLQHSGVISSKCFHMKNYTSVEPHVEIITTFTFYYY